MGEQILAAVPPAFPKPGQEGTPDGARPEDPRRAWEIGECPECGAPLLPVGGCRVCRDCGWEACGW